MATKQEIVDLILARMEGAGQIHAKKMFGEYGIYCDGRMIALVCDDQLFIKPTDAGKAYLGEVEEGQPYPGAKYWFLIPEDDWDDAPRLAELVRITTAAVPLPVKKTPKKAGTRGKASGTQD